MFPARTDEIGSDLPLWAVQADQKPGVASVHTFMGGWTEADGKQYAEGEFRPSFSFSPLSSCLGVGMDELLGRWGLWWTESWEIGC